MLFFIVLFTLISLVFGIKEFDLSLPKGWVPPTVGGGGLPPSSFPPSGSNLRPKVAYSLNSLNIDSHGIGGNLGLQYNQPDYSLGASMGGYKPYRSHGILSDFRVGGRINF